MKKSYWLTLAVVVIVGLIAMYIYFSVDLNTKNAGVILLYWIGTAIMTWLIKKVLDTIFDFTQFDKPTIRKYFAGQWKSEYQEPNQLKSGAYLIEIKNKTEWWENGIHLWNITGFSCEHNNMTFTKVDTQSSVRRKVNQLKIVRAGEEYTGNEDVHTPITYKRIFTSASTHTTPKEIKTQSPYERPPRKDGHPKITPPHELPGLQSEPLRTQQQTPAQEKNISDYFSGSWQSSFYILGKGQQLIVVTVKHFFDGIWYKWQWFEDGSYKFDILNFNDTE